MGSLTNTYVIPMWGLGECYCCFIVPPREQEVYVVGRARQTLFAASFNAFCTLVY